MNRTHRINEFHTQQTINYALQMQSNKGSICFELTTTQSLLCTVSSLKESKRNQCKRYAKDKQNTLISLLLLFARDFSQSNK